MITKLDNLFEQCNICQEQCGDLFDKNVCSSCDIKRNIEWIEGILNDNENYLKQQEVKDNE